MSFPQAVYTSALLAAGTAVEMTQMVCDGKLQNGIAVVRLVYDSLCNPHLFTMVTGLLVTMQRWTVPEGIATLTQLL